MSSTNTDLPVIFLAFANEQLDGRYLDNVVKEAKELTTILAPLSSNLSTNGSENALCELVIKTNVSFSEVADVLQTPRYRKNLVIFHYAGHADGYQLLLEGKDGESELVQGEGLVPILSRLKNLKLVFLNGCSTQRLAQDLTSRGILTVIGTVTSIADDTALLLSTRFYKGLANGLTLAGAWEDAKDAARAVKDLSKHHRGIKLNKDESGRFPWDVAFKDDAAREVFDRWNLPDAANYPLFNLPEPKKSQLPPSPFLFLKPYSAEHAEIFFGRSYYIRDLYLKIIEPNSPSIILLYGESGAGKSSLLDAGLRPRLEAATSDEDPSRRLFEVHYERRDHELGLVGTLAKMLSYYTVEETDAAPEDAAPTNGDANRETLARIESLAHSLEEETADTLLSFIDRYKAIRASRSVRSRKELYQSGVMDATAGAQLREAWKQIEQKTGRRLILILDQVEEQFTRPNPEIRQELENLLQVLKDIFSVPPNDETDVIRGKIILGYREEFNAKIEARFKDYELSRSKVFLEQLNEADIKDIFRGLQSGEAGRYYNISVEDQLPDRMAGDLLKGNSAVAPVLQLLLTKLWKKTHDEKLNKAEFTIDAYNAIQSQGEEMEEYFDTQMKRVRQWNAEVVESGLALDILHFHVSDLGTSSQRHIDAIKQRYKHLETEYDYPKGFIVELVNKLKSPEIFLLNDLSRGYTSLPHDTLAPIIMREYNRSDKLGQRSARILDTKAPDLRNAEDEEALRQLRLDYHDLDVVLDGKKGMRDLGQRERQLLQISLEEREKRRRLRQILIKGAIVAGLFILVLSLLAGSLSVSMTEQVTQGAVNRAHEASLLEENKDPSQAIELAQFAYNESKTRHLDMVQHLYQLHDKYSGTDAYYLDEAQEDAKQLPRYLSLQPNATINSLAYHPGLGALATLQNNTVVYWPNQQTEQPLTLDLQSYFSDPNLLEVGFTADGQNIQVISRYNRQPLYAMNGELVSTLWMPVYSANLEDVTDDYYEEEESPASDEVTTGQQLPPENYLGYYDFYTGRFVSAYGITMDKDAFINQYSYLLDPDGYLEDDQLEVDNGLGGRVRVDTLFSFHLLNERRGLLNRKAYNRLLSKQWWGTEEYRNSVQPLPTDTVVTLRQTGLSMGTYNAALIWNADSLSGLPASTFYDENALYFFNALTNGQFLTVGPESGLRIQAADGATLRTLLPASTQLIDLAVSPGDEPHILAMSKDSVFIWELSGAPIVQYAQSDVRYLGCSADGSRFLTGSPKEVKAWMAGQSGVITYVPPSKDQSIVLARLHKDNTHLILGLSDPPRQADKKGFLSGLRKSDKNELQVNSRIVLWNMLSRQVTRSFEAPPGPLFDATVSEDGRYAVALQPGSATILSDSQGEMSPEQLLQRTIEATATVRRKIVQLSSVELSPGGTYIVRHSPHERRLELFDRQGRPVNTYGYRNGFMPGFNGRMFTPDDHFLISSKTDEVLYLHPEHAENGSVIQWASQYVVDIEDKQTYQLDTYMDYLPGTSGTAKWWGILLILVSFIFVLLYFSDYIIRFLQQKRYTELGLYTACFLVLSLLVLIFWGAGNEEPALRSLALYTIVWATLGIAAVGVYRAAQEGRYGVLAALALVAAFMLFGTAKFAAAEGRQATETAQREINNWEQALVRDYKLYPEYYNEYSEENSNPADTSLTLAQLREIVVNNPDEELFQPPPELPSEGWLILFGFIVLAVFLGLVGYPVYRAIVHYRADNRPKFYRALLLPVTYLSIAFWVGIIALSDEDIIDPIGEVLNILSFLLLAAIIIRQSRRYIKARDYVTFGVFALPTLVIVPLLLSESGTYTLAIAAAYLLGRQYRREEKAGLSFLLFSMAIFLAVGALFWTFVPGSLTVLIGLLVMTPLLAFVYSGLRTQLDRAAVRKVDGRPRWINYLAILGLWVLGVSAALYFADELFLNLDDDYYYEDDYAYYEDDLYYDDEGEILLTGDEEYLPEDEEYLPEDEEYLPEEEEILPEDELSDEEEDLFDEESSEDFDEGEDLSGTEASSDLQLLVQELFDSEQAIRDEARQQLSAYYRDDPALLETLIQYNYDNPDVNEGIWNTLYLLQVQTDERLQAYRELLLPYLDWTAGKGYGPSTMDRIQRLQDRIGM